MGVTRKKTTKPEANDAGRSVNTPGNGSPRSATTSPTSPVKTPQAPRLVPANPESKPPAEARRKRLSKAFARPLDKKFKKETFVRDRFTLPASEYAILVDLKERLGEQGAPVKKSELVRVALHLLSKLDEVEIKAVLEMLSRVG